MEFYKWLEDKQMNYTRLVVFDFDGTIGNVPERPNGWGGKDWWGHKDSLSHPHYDGSVNQEVVDAFKEAKADPNAHVLLLTGRRGVIAHEVRKVLRANGLYGRRMIPDTNLTALKHYQDNVKKGIDETHPLEHGHEEYYSGDHVTEPDYPQTTKGKPDGSTLPFKMYICQKKMTPLVRTAEFWDDRADHAPHWIKLGLDLLKQYDQLNIIYHRVYPPVAGTGGVAYVQHIPIRPGMKY